MSTTRKALLVAPVDMHERNLRPTPSAIRRATMRQATDGTGVVPARNDAPELTGVRSVPVSQSVPDPTAWSVLAEVSTLR